MNKKRIFLTCAIFVVILSLFALVACDDKDNNNDSNTGYPEIGFYDGSGVTVEDKTISLEVGTTVESIDLNNIIYTKNDTKYYVFEGEDGRLFVPDKKINLKIGNNTFYIIAKLGENEVKYTLNVWRNFTTSVTYYVNGDLFDIQTNVQSHTYLEDFRAPENLPYGIEFLGWDCEGYYVTELYKRFDAKLKYKSTTTILLEPEGGECDISSVQVNFGANGMFYKLPVPKREGYRFWCWMLEDQTFIADWDGRALFKYWEIEETTITAYAFWVKEN